MSGIAGVVVTGALLGLGAAVPPGPVNLETARRASRGGFLSGASVGFGAVTVDVVLALLLSLGWLRLIYATPWIRIPVTVFGIVLLVYLSMGALRSFLTSLRTRRTLLDLESAQYESEYGAMGGSRSTLNDEPASSTVAARQGTVGGYFSGLLLCASSPYQALFWLTVVPAVIAEEAGGAGVEARFGLVAGVFLATLTWVVLFSSLVSVARSLDQRRWLPATMDLLGGTLLLSFAALSAWRLAGELLSSASPPPPAG